MHIEAVSDLTMTEAFIAGLRLFIARRGHPTLIWSDNGSNFVGANHELEYYQFLEQQMTKGMISEFCSTRNTEWRFIPEHIPNFGGLWAAAVKSAKIHLNRILGNVKLAYKELSTILVQVEACLNSRPLIPIHTPDDDGIEVLTPGNFLIGRPLCALPDPPVSYRSVSYAAGISVKT